MSAGVEGCNVVYRINID